MIDRSQSAIVQCAEADDVLHAIAYARENELEISVRGGGHNIAGSAVCDNGVMIDSLRSFGEAYGEHIGVQPYAQWQQAFDPLRSMLHPAPM